MKRTVGNKKGFTMIEILTVIAILGILVLIAAPKFLGYTEKAQLARIQHDVKVMEVEIQSVMVTDPLEVPNYKDNKKDLKEIIVKKQLFEKQGLAKSLEKSQPMKKVAIYNNIDSDSSHPKVGVGGELYQIKSYENYKIIPEEKKRKIRTRLDGTFYVNDTGKVYYEPEKPIHFSINVIGGHLTDEDLANQSCSAPEPVDYDFDHLTGTIMKYSGKEQYLTIPSQFKVDGKCWTVKIIGKGAFSKMVPPIKNVVIPPTVEKIEEDAFEGNEIEEVIIPPSVNEIEDNAFGDNPIKDVVVQKPEKDIEIGENAFPPNVKPEFSAPKPEDVGLDAELSPSGGAVITGPSQPNGTNPGDGNDPEDGTDPGENEPSIPDGVLVIPPKVIIDGEEVPVEEIQEGAFQGEGLIEVHLPDTIERIEDYAFAGNQLIGIKIPNSVKFIGTYAFAYNELTNEKGETKPTIAYINFKGNEQIQLLNTRTGDIEHNGSKINPLYGSEMLDAIWIDSRSEEDPEPTYPIIHPNGDKEYEDGRIETSDGGLRQADGSIKYPNGDVRNKDGILVHPDGSVTLNDGTYVPIATDADFSGTSDGNFKYTGAKRSIVLPKVIKGVTLTKANYMFQTTYIERVVSLENNITNMSYMFYGSQATSLNLSSLDTSKVTDMSYMFRESKATSINVSLFNTSNVTDMYQMFYKSQATSLDFSNWNTSKVTNMANMFAYSKSTSLDLSSFDTSNVTQMYQMFYESEATSLDLNSFNTSKVTNMSLMFAYSKATSLDLSSFDTSKVVNMSSMFYSSQATILDLSSFNTSNSTNMTGMFRNSPATTGYARTQADADRLNKSSMKPSTLTFTTK